MTHQNLYVRLKLLLYSKKDCDQKSYNNYVHVPYFEMRFCNNRKGTVKVVWGYQFKYVIFNLIPKGCQKNMFIKKFGIQYK